MTRAALPSRRSSASTPRTSQKCAARSERYAETFGDLSAWLDRARETYGERAFDMHERIDTLDKRLGINRRAGDGGRGRLRGGA